MKDIQVCIRKETKNILWAQFCSAVGVAIVCTAILTALVVIVALFIFGASLLDTWAVANPDTARQAAQILLCGAFLLAVCYAVYWVGKPVILLVYTNARQMAEVTCLLRPLLHEAKLQEGVTDTKWDEQIMASMRDKLYVTHKISFAYDCERQEVRSHEEVIRLLTTSMYREPVEKDLVLHARVTMRKLVDKP